MNSPEIVGQNTSEKEIKIEKIYHFASSICMVEQPEYLKVCNELSTEHLKEAKKISQMDKIYPVVMTDSFAGDIRIREFADLICEISGSILGSQGYNMTNTQVYINEMWTQEHFQYSGQEEHVHPGSVISGFYFLECPKDGPRVVLHDPSPAKRFLGLPEFDMNTITESSVAVNYTPHAGMMMFTNSWVPHSFTKNPSKSPFRFIHFNVSLIPAITLTPTTAEVI